MDQNNPYFKQVQLLVQVLPVVAKQECFALKGGTAINLFHRDLPRLSVDIDLVYLPNHERQQALDGIAEGLKAIKRELESNTHHEVQDRVSKDGVFAGLTISVRDANIKIEVNHVLRGAVHLQVWHCFHHARASAFGLGFHIGRPVESKHGEL